MEITWKTGLYPSLPRGDGRSPSTKSDTSCLPGGGQNKADFRIFTKISEMKDSIRYLEEEERKYLKLFKKTKRLNTVDKFFTAVQGAGVTVSIAGAATSVAGITILVSTSAFIVGGALSVSSFLVSTTVKLYHEKQAKYVTYLSHLQLAIRDLKSAYHNAMDDQKIDEREYRKMSRIVDDYRSLKNNNRAEFCSNNGSSSTLKKTNYKHKY